NSYSFTVTDKLHDQLAQYKHEINQLTADAAHYKAKIIHYKMKYEAECDTVCEIKNLELKNKHTLLMSYVISVTLLVHYNTELCTLTSTAVISQENIKEKL
ncbi:hypothetical protein ACJ72_05811, partial [Emergomyces africanus]